MGERVDVMCARMVPLTYDEAAAALDAREHAGRARITRRGELDPVYDAYPGSEAPAYVMDGNGCLATVELTWGVCTRGRVRRRLQHAHRDRVRPDQAGPARHEVAGHRARPTFLVPSCTSC